MLEWLSTPFGDTQHFRGECGSSAVCLAWPCLSRQQILYLHILYVPSCKTAHPFPPSTKATRACLWKPQPESLSVYAKLNELDTMQINSASIWFECFQRLGVGGQSGLFALGTFCAKPFPQPPVWLVVNFPALPVPGEITQAPAAHFILTFGKEPRLWWIRRLVGEWQLQLESCCSFWSGRRCYSDYARNV